MKERQEWIVSELLEIAVLAKRTALHIQADGLDQYGHPSVAAKTEFGSLELLVDRVGKRCFSTWPSR